MLKGWPQTLIREGNEAIVLTTVNPQPSLWEAILPEICLRMPTELESVDRLLDDPVFFEPTGLISTPSGEDPRSRSRPTCG